MRRFSQRNALVTLSEINITPLLDLAFVLLIIFVITTPLLEKGIDVHLPKVDSQADRKLQKENIRTVEINAQGQYSIKNVKMQLSQIERELVQDYRLNPRLIVFIRADENSRTKELAPILNLCQKNGIECSMRTEPPNGR